MDKFNYDVAVSESTPDRATRKINAACALMDILSTEELEKLVHIAHTQTDKLAMFRGYIKNS